MVRSCKLNCSLGMVDLEACQALRSVHGASWYGLAQRVWESRIQDMGLAEEQSSACQQASIPENDLVEGPGVLTEI